MKAPWLYTHRANTVDSKDPRPKHQPNSRAKGRFNNLNKTARMSFSASEFRVLLDRLGKGCTLPTTWWKASEHAEERRTWECGEKVAIREPPMRWPLFLPSLIPENMWLPRKSQCQGSLHNLWWSCHLKEGNYLTDFHLFWVPGIFLQIPNILASKQDMQLLWVQYLRHMWV